MVTMVLAAGLATEVISGMAGATAGLGDIKTAHLKTLYSKKCRLKR